MRTRDGAIGTNGKSGVFSMYTLYIANKNYSSWSLRPWVLLREHAIAFSEQLVPFEAASNRERFRRFSPSAKVPCLIDQAVTVWDSLGIAEYLPSAIPVSGRRMRPRAHGHVAPRQRCTPALACCESAAR